MRGESRPSSIQPTARSEELSDEPRFLTGTLPFREIWVADFEFLHPDGESLPTAVVCLVAWELRSGQKLRLWQNQFDGPPYSLAKDSLFVAYSSHAEFSCHFALGWPMPERILDLYFEFLRQINVTPRPKPQGSPGKKKERATLLRAMTYYGLDAISVDEKTQWRDLIATGGPWNEEEREGILSYCEDDVRATAWLLEAMLRRGHIDLPRALFRGRYAPALTRMQKVGVPIDQKRFELLKRNEASVKRHLLQTLGAQYDDVYDDKGCFGERRFMRYLVRRGWSWPLLDTGELDLKEKTFKAMAAIHPELENLRQLRFTLDKLKLTDLQIVGGFNRCWLAPFSARTGRNQPSNAQFIFGPAVWLRAFLIQPPPGWAIAYCDWEAQEAGLAAGLSRDLAMQQAYLSQDCYITFGVQAGLLPSEATKETHGEMRGLLKITWLSTQYGIGYYALAERLDRAEIVARNLLASHRKVYKTYWAWSDNRISRSYQYNRQSTVFGWLHTFKERPKVNSVRNFPVQANGGEALRLGACLMTENGIQVCAPVHDAYLIMAREDQIEAVAARACAYMEEASAVVLNGFRLKTEKHIYTHPNYFRDPHGRGGEMVARVMELL